MSKLPLTALKMVPIPEAVAVSSFTTFIDASTGAFVPGPVQGKAALVMLNELARWTAALATLRVPPP